MTSFETFHLSYSYTSPTHGSGTNHLQIRWDIVHQQNANAKLTRSVRTYDQYTSQSQTSLPFPSPPFPNSPCPRPVNNQRKHPYNMMDTTTKTPCYP